MQGFLQGSRQKGQEAVNFLKVRQTHFPVDSIAQIDEIGGRVRVSLATGVKIDLDPVEGERVLRQVSGNVPAPASVPQQDTAQVVALMSRVSALEAKVASMRNDNDKARMKHHA
jgi:hypothetical protein